MVSALLVSDHPAVLTVVEHHKAFHTSANLIELSFDLIVISHKNHICKSIDIKHRHLTPLNKEVID